jgi:dihydropteroate synthase
MGSNINSLTNLAIKPWVLRDHAFSWGKQTYIMGVLNVTPDSFSDGGQFNSLDLAMAQAQHMVAAGAHLLDIGGQSTRPQADEVPLVEELNRVVPVIRALRRTGESIAISVDTTRGAVARAAVEAGADLVNDISGATYDPEMLSIVSELQVPIALMHIRGTPKTMQQLTDYSDLMAEIYEFLARRVEAAVAAGITPDRIIVDPGIGFAKTCEQNLEILRKLPHLRSLGCPILVGVSRKSFIGRILNQPDPIQRIWGTVAACSAAIASRTDILRVHDVAPLQEVCKVSDAIWR